MFETCGTQDCHGAEAPRYTAKYILSVHVTLNPLAHATDFQEHRFVSTLKGEDVVAVMPGVNVDGHIYCMWDHS